MVRTPSFDKNGIKKGAWSPEEDSKLEAYIRRYGHSNWRELPKLAGLMRCGKSCRLRWMNYLRPDVRSGSYTVEEEGLIIKLHEKHGNKNIYRWSMIARRLAGRTDNEIKNHWHTHLKKRHISSLAAESTTSLQRQEPRQLMADDESFRNIPILESSSIDSSSTINAEGGKLMDKITSDLFKPAASYITSMCAGEFAGGIQGDDDFWTMPFNVEDMDMMSSYDDCSFMYDQSIDIIDLFSQQVLQDLNIL